jgi:hypothetical protein
MPNPFRQRFMLKLRWPETDVYALSILLPQLPLMARQWPYLRGDWICPDCHNHVFKLHLVCPLCNTPMMNLRLQAARSRTPTQPRYGQRDTEPSTPPKRSRPLVNPGASTPPKLSRPLAAAGERMDEERHKSHLSHIELARLFGIGPNSLCNPVLVTFVNELAAESSSGQIDNHLDMANIQAGCVGLVPVVKGMFADSMDIKGIATVVNVRSFQENGMVPKRDSLVRSAISSSTASIDNWSLDREVECSIFQQTVWVPSIS